MRSKLYKCDDCGAQDEFTSYIKARQARWAISKDYVNCYCPKCAPAHRIGKAKLKDEGTQTATGFEQLKIENL